MHYEFLDDHQRSTHQKNPNKKKPRYSQPTPVATESVTGAPGQSQLTYYSVVKCSKPYTLLNAITRGTETESGGWSQQDGPMGTSEVVPSAYPYHHTTASGGHKRVRGRGAGVAASQQNGSGPESGDPSLIYKCHFDECFFEADSKDRLDFHLFSHCSSRFKCPFCPYVSNVLNDIKRHVTKGGKHEGASMFNCPNGCCDFATNCDKAFREHLRSVHFAKTIDDKSLTSYIEELFVNTQTDPGTRTSAGDGEQIGADA